MIDRGDIRQAITRCSNHLLHCRALVISSGACYWQPDCKIQRSGGTVREIDVWAESNISALVICIIVCLSWAVNHYRDNAITYKAQRDKNARELEAGERGNYWHAVRQRDVAALDGKHEGKADAVPEMMLCVMMLPLVVVGCISAVIAVSAWSHHRLRRDNAASPRTDTAERDYFTLRREADHYAKTTGELQKYINEQCR